MSFVQLVTSLFYDKTALHKRVRNTGKMRQNTWTVDVRLI